MFLHFGHLLSNMPHLVDFIFGATKETLAMVSSLLWAIPISLLQQGQRSSSLKISYLQAILLKAMNYMFNYALNYKIFCNNRLVTRIFWM